MQDDRQEAIESFANGMQIPDIAEELEVSVSTIYRWLSEADLVDRLKTARNDAIIEAYSNSDIPINDILQTYSISQSALYKILHKRNIPLRSKTTETATLSDEEIVKMYQKGNTLSYIQLHSNRSYNYIYKTLRKFRINLRKPYSHRI